MQGMGEKGMDWVRVSKRLDERRIVFVVAID